MVPARRVPASTSCRRTLRGMTLVELMIVVVVVAVLAAIAVPGYRGAMRKAHRAEAKTALTLCAQRLERYFTENGRYTGATKALCAADEPPSYELQLPEPGAVAYTLSAVPRGGQSGDACGTFTLDQNGGRGVGGTSLSVAECW